MPVIGCIGCGNMGSALLRGFAAKLDKNQWRLKCFNRSAEKMLPLRDLGIDPMPGIKEISEEADILLIAVKPYQVEEVLNMARPWLKKDALIISIAAGVSLERIRILAGPDCRVARCMPTLTAETGHGVFALCFDPSNFSEKKQEKILGLFSMLGYCVRIEEKRMTDFSAYMGAGPAFIFATMQGLAQAGITLGFSMEENSRMIPELFWGCAMLAEKQKKTFAQLRDEVCSPAGLTIAGVNSLDKAGLSGILVDAVLASARRGKEMEKNGGK